MAKRSPRPAPQSPAAQPFLVFAQAALLTLATFWVYFPALNGAWLWDDDILITKNAVVQDPAGLWKIWFQPTGNLIDYFPLKVTVEWIEWHLFGDNPFGYHLVSIALHIIGALLLWKLFAQLGLRWAWLGGFLFAIHPVAVESVAWIAELKNTLSLPLFLLAIIHWLDFDQRRRPRDYILSLAFFLLAMLCKTSMVAFPIVILLHAWWKRRRITAADLKTSVPFFVVSLALGLVTILFLQFQYNHVPMAMGGPLSRLACAGLGIAFYFSKCVLPIGLMPIYPRWDINPPEPLQFTPWLVIIAALFYCWKKRATWGRHALLGLGYFLIMVLPFAGIFGGTYMRFSWVMDHIIYLPLIGIIGLATAALESIAKRGPAFRYGSQILAAFLLTTSALASHSYASIFASPLSYWTYAEQKNHDAWPAHNNLGNVLEQDGKSAEAMREFDLAVQGNPDYYEARLNRGQLRLLLGDNPGAIADLDRAIALQPESPEPHFPRAVYYLATGDTTAALGELQRFRQVSPKDPNADYAALWIWILRSQKGEKSTADQDLTSAAWLATPTAWATQNKQFLLGQISETDYLAAAKDDGQHCEAWYYAGTKRLLNGNKSGAKEAFQNSRATNKISFFEYTLSRAKLQR